MVGRGFHRKGFSLLRAFDLLNTVEMYREFIQLQQKMLLK
jgi:hypothetical protein